MKISDLHIGQTVYHREVYNHREPLTIIGLTEDRVLLKGDFSGGTHNVTQQDWLPIKGLSLIYNYDYKKSCRETAVCIEELVKNHKPYHELDNTQKTMIDLLDMVFKLTTDVSLNGCF